MEKILDLRDGWRILQDVYNTGERLGLYKNEPAITGIRTQISEWEPLKELKHLQLLYAPQPYFGRELRYFNQAPWWYQIQFEVTEKSFESASLRFTNVDYYAKIWLNGKFVGEHEGYSAPFSFDVGNMLKTDEANCLTVKVSSPWDVEIEQDAQECRTLLVKRNMVKGTYEHSDTFIQRDVNPVGIYGKVQLILSRSGTLEENPELGYRLSKDMKSADLTVKARLSSLTCKEKYIVGISIKEKDSGLRKVWEKYDITAENRSEEKEFRLHIEDIRLWNTWDHGYPWMYTAEIYLEKEGTILCRREVSLAFRKTEIERTREITRFYLNEKPFYIRGTSYFPDCYISAMMKERYLRDLLNIKAAGFNLVRVHVHTEQDIFYDLCDSLGIAVLQDSEYNWTHPSTDEWADRFINVYRENVRFLKHHPCLICWILMNEPGCLDPDGKMRKRFMEENPGPRLYREIQRMDPGRPIIKGSFCEEDPYSGDSHNYRGSLNGGEYGDIYRTTEKMNTEYGFDAPGCTENLKKIPRVYQRLGSVVDGIEQIQEYQYKLIKYYTEHYRIQKYAPCSGYVQFMFIDLSPQSFFGLYDWWGTPKKGLLAMLESNQPVGIFAEHRESLSGLYAVNDTDQCYSGCTAEWIITETGSGKCVAHQTCQIDLPADSCIKVTEFSQAYGQGQRWNLSLRLWDSDHRRLALNAYTDICTLMPRIEGHPQRISHELGIRLYWAE